MNIGTVVAVAVLAAGTYGFRLAGLLLAGRVRLPPAVSSGVMVAATTLLTALVATATLTENGHFVAGFARPVGVAIALLVAYRKAPFVVVILVASAVTALLRCAGMP